MNNELCIFDIPENIPTSFLLECNKIQSSDMMLVSEPFKDTETEFMSKHITGKDLFLNISSSIGLSKIRNDIANIYDNGIKVSDFTDEWISSEYDPCVLCSFSQGCVVNEDGTKTAGIISYETCYLSSMMYTVFNNLFNENNKNIVNSNLKKVIPSLSEKTVSIPYDIRNKSYISAVTFKNGHIFEIETADLNESLVDKIKDSEKEVENYGDYIYAVETQNGIIKNIESRQLSSVVGSVQYCDITMEDGIPDDIDSRYRKHNLKIAKMTEYQYKSMKQPSDEHKTIQNCLYFVVE